MKILCATDLLPKTESALERAGICAEALGADLSLLHVVQPTESERMLKQDLQRAMERLQSGAKSPLRRYARSPDVYVRTGEAARVLIETAKQLQVDLVVLGKHRKRPIRDALAGTLAQRVLSALSCPVLIVNRMPQTAYRNVLLALDHSQASANAVRAAEALLLTEDTRATVVHAFRPRFGPIMTSAGILGNEIDAFSEERKGQASAALRDFLRETSDAPSRYELIFENLTSSSAVQRTVRNVKPDLLVVGTRGRGRWRRALLGSVANRIVSVAKSDILVVPERVATARWRRARADRLGLDVIPGA
jgi:nucleotide-binding universal stress UspA family protein